MINLKEEKSIQYPVSSEELIESSLLKYPFDMYSIENIKDISDRVNFYGVNYLNQNNLEVNGVWYKGSNDDRYQQVLAYIKLLGNKIYQFEEQTKHLTALAMSLPSINLYIIKVMDKINQCIRENIQLGRKTEPEDINKALMQNDLEDTLILKNTIELITNLYGYKIVEDKVEKDEKLNDLIGEIYYVVLNIPKILNAPNCEIRENESEYKRTLALKELDSFKKIMEK